MFCNLFTNLEIIFVQKISKRRLINYLFEINSHNFFNKIANKKKFENNCEVLNYIIPKLFVKLNLYSLFNQQYYYDFN